MRYSLRLHLGTRSNRKRKPVQRYSPATVLRKRIRKPRRMQQQQRQSRPNRNASSNRHPPNLRITSSHQSNDSDELQEPEGVVDPIFPYSIPVRVVSPYEAHLDYVDRRTNSDKFYVIQLVENGCNFDVCTKWGRRGTVGSYKIERTLDRQDGIKQFEIKFKSKTGLRFDDRGARELDGKYRMTRRLHEAGAGLGEVAVSLMWDNNDSTRNDLDLHVVCPSGEVIMYSHKQSTCGGFLDVDRQQAANEPIENIVFSRAPSGSYKVMVHNYSANHINPTPFRVGLTLDGKREIIEGIMPPRPKVYPKPHDRNPAGLQQKLWRLVREFIR